MVSRTKAIAEAPAARQKILDAAYELFARTGIQSVGVDAIVARSGVAKMTLYRHFSSKEELALAFLDLRNERWTVDWLKTGLEQRSNDPTQRLLLIFDLYHDWFQSPDFEGCSFIKIMMEAAPGSALHQAAAQQLDKLGVLITDLVKSAGVSDPLGLSKAWQILMKGAIVSACEGNRNAGQEAKKAASALLKAWSLKPT